MLKNASLKYNISNLVTLAQQGDRKAMGLLIEKELPWVRAIVMGYIRSQDQVDDVCQETFFSAWRAIKNLKNKKRFKAWLYRIAINKVRSFFRERGRQKAQSLTGNIANSNIQNFETVFDKSEVLKKALYKIDPKYRDPLIVHYLQGKSCAETAQVLGLKPATARIRLLRGREKLGKILRKEERL